MDLVSDTSPTLQVVCGDIPDFARVELPCFVRSADTALECLGGKDTVCDAIKDTESTLQFKFPSENIIQTKVAASVVNKNGLLLKIRRKKAEAGGQPSDTTCQIIGTVSKTFNFSNLADYEFLPTVPAPAQPATVRATLGEEVVVLDTVPHSFSRDNVNKGAQRLVLHESLRKPTTTSRPSTTSANVTAQNSKSTSAAATPSKKAALEEDVVAETETKNIQEANSRNPDKGLAYFINIDDPVPDQHPRGEYPYENERGIVLVRLLKKLFSIIPILSREQIETYLNLEGRVHLFKSCLPYVAYNLVKGPFRQLWVRYGYDPKQHRSSALYQTIHFRVSPQVVQDVTERIGKKVGTSVSRSKMVDLDSLRVSEMPLNSVTYLLLNRPQQDPPIFAYNHVLKMQLVLQIFQLMDPAILEYLRNTRLLSSFDNNTGWFPEESIKNLRVMALNALPERIHRFVSLPDTVIWDATLPPVISTVPASASSEDETAAAEASIRPFDAASLSEKFRAAHFNINEDASDLGFDEHSTGLFVTCNRTLNTLRAYLQSAATAESNTVLADAITSAGEMNRDEVRTEDGIYLGKVLAWHRRYATTLKGLGLQEKPLPATKGTSSSAGKAKKPRSTLPKAAKAPKPTKAAKIPKLVTFDGVSGPSSAALGAAHGLAGLHASALGGHGVEAFAHFDADDDGDDSNSGADSDSDSGGEEFP